MSQMILWHPLQLDCISLTIPSGRNARAHELARAVPYVKRKPMCLYYCARQISEFAHDGRVRACVNRSKALRVHLQAFCGAGIVAKVSLIWQAYHDERRVLCQIFKGITFSVAIFPILALSSDLAAISRGQGIGQPMSYLPCCSARCFVV